MVSGIPQARRWLVSTQAVLRRSAPAAGAWLTVAVVIASCGRAPAPAPEVEPVPSEVGIQVENQNARNVVIYLHGRGTTSRLGLITTGGVGAWVLPWRRIGADGTLRLRAEVMGSDEWIATELLRVEPGQMVRWTLMPNLGMSVVGVY